MQSLLEGWCTETPAGGMALLSFDAAHRLQPRQSASGFEARMIAPEAQVAELGQASQEPLENSICMTLPMLPQMPASSTEGSRNQVVAAS
mmetsp:Transcript_105907/g.330261  ORF Transcript_105907/g.330261 Transcript_105907/m.330261 type:complete len:90 (+) Transcript_105907:649-918(+)